MENQRAKHARSRQRQQSNNRDGSTKLRPINVRRLIIGTIVVALVVALICPCFSQQAEAKIKAKKVLKKLVKGLVYKNLSTRKNFLPMPVPIPVPIELSEPPVYLKGKPKYVTIYKPAPAPVVKPTTVYHMPVYSPTYEYMSMDPMSLYGSMMMSGNGANSYDKYANTIKAASTASDSSQSALGMINFTDYDDDIGNYYLRNGGSSSKHKQQYAASAASTASSASASASASAKRRTDRDETNLVLMATDEQEALLDHDEPQRHHRLNKRQAAYESSYENEPPCYGFPLEINIKSRIKMDQIFPIHGKSQFKKCIKVGRPLLPPVEDYPPQY